MDIEEIRKLDKVVDRLAAAGPSPVSAPHCWFCGSCWAWFQCSCQDAQDARDGKRNKPRVVERGGQMLIILDPDIIERNKAWGRKRYEPPVTQPAPVTPSEDEGVTDEGWDGAPVTLSVAENVTPEPESVTEASEPDAAVTPLSPAAERMRRMRQRRAKAKDTPT